jgi:hypothetical protein
LRADGSVGFALPEAVAEQEHPVVGEVLPSGVQRGEQPTERVGGSHAEHQVRFPGRPVLGDVLAAQFEPIGQTEPGGLAEDAVEDPTRDVDSDSRDAVVRLQRAQQPGALATAQIKQVIVLPADGPVEEVRHGAVAQRRGYRMVEVRDGSDLLSVHRRCLTESGSCVAGISRW